MADKKPEAPTNPALAAETLRLQLLSEAQAQREKELEATRQKREKLKAQTAKQGGYAYYKIAQPYYRQGQHWPGGSIVRIPEDEDPSVTWEPVEKAGASETPVTTAGQMNQPVRMPTAPFTSEVYEKPESTVETNPPGKESKDSHFASKDTTKDVGKETKDAAHGHKRPSDKNL